MGDSERGVNPRCKKIRREIIIIFAAECLSEDQTRSPVSAQFATILDKSWSASLSDTKLKEKLAKYDRSENCGRLLAPKVTPKSGREYRISGSDKF